MPYTKFRVIDERPPPGDHPTSQTDEWAFIQPAGVNTAKLIAETTPRGGEQEADGRRARTCDISAQALLGKNDFDAGSSMSVFVQHLDAPGDYNPGIFTRYIFSVTPDEGLPGNDTLILRIGIDVNGELQSAAPDGVSNLASLGGVVGDQGESLPPTA